VSDGRGLVTRPRTQIEDGWVSSCYGLRLAAPVLVNSWETAGTCSCTTVLVPLAETDNRALLDRVASEIGSAADFLNVPHDVVRALDDSLRASVERLSSAGVQLLR
ncbi:MAG: hypothetical protein ACREJN_00250, partial [Nitrospiraceae bacterium]